MLEVDFLEELADSTKMAPMCNYEVHEGFRVLGFKV